MAKFKVKDVEFDFDIFDADNAELYESVTEKVKKEAEKTVKNESLSQKIRRLGSAVCNAIDTLFGEGKSFELFGDKINLVDITATYQAIVTELNKANTDLATKEISRLTTEPPIKATK